MNTIKNKIEVRNLCKRFGDLKVIDDISFNVKEGEFLCIVGPTGCGKTTFLNSLTKLYDISSGEILIDSEPVDLKKHNVSYVLQEASCMSWLTVEQNVKFGLDIKKIPKNEADIKAKSMMEMVGLTQFKDYYPNQISMSMLQRVVIARSFATNPELLLMDEPYGQLDLVLKYKLEDDLLKLWKQLKPTVIFITHNIEEAVYLGQRILVLTNKPSKIKEDIINELPYPRNIADPIFVNLRNRITDLIKWW